MRDYLSLPNLHKALLLASVITAMSVGRLVHAGVNLALYIPATFLAMTFVSGAVTAWGRRAGMAGLATDAKTLTPGVGAAVLLALAALPVHYFGSDPILREALASADNPAAVEMSYPSTTSGRFALMLWSAGFQAMFFVAAPMSFFGRLTGRAWVAAGFCIAVRTYVVHLQVGHAGLAEQVPLFLASAVVTTLVACVLFARYGLIPAMIFAAGLDLRVFF